MRIHRILSFPQSGNLLLIGNVGNHLSSIIKLALYIADIQLLSIDCSKTSLFYDSMRTAIRTAGSENKTVGLIFSSKDLILNEYLDTINSLLNNGECLHLFSNDEMDGLYHAIGPSIKREHPNMVLDPKKFFNNRVKRNLHICLALTPNSDTFSHILKDYTNMVSNCQIYWIQDWTEESLLNESKNFMRGRLDTQELRDKVARCMSEIHLYMLNECRQVPWTGISDKEIKIKETRMVDKQGPKKEQVSKTFSVNLPNWPYSKSILQELIKVEHTNKKDKSPLHFFVGTNTYFRFMNSFWYYFTTKAKQCEDDIIRLRKVLETLNKTREGANLMKAYIKDLKVRCKQSETDSEESLKKLIEMTTCVEKLKAKLGLGGSLTTLMKMQEDIDMSKENVASENLTKLLNLEAPDEYDEEFIRMKEEGQKSRLAKMTENLEKAKREVEDCKLKLGDKKKQAENWKHKMDKACIERIRSFQNPPALIGQIMEMITVLIGKRKFKEPNDGSHSAKTESSTKDEKSELKGSKPKISTNKMERLDRSQWKQYQNIMQDSSKFVELLYSIEWEEGLSIDVIQAVEGYLMKGKDGQIGITGEGSLIDSSKDVNIPAVKSDYSSKGITISAARYASEDASILVHFAIAVVEYSRLCIPLKAAKERVDSLRQEQMDYDRKKKEHEQEILKLARLEESLATETDSKSAELLTNKDLPRLVAELEELQQKFDEAAVKKYKLHKELDSCIQRLESATLIINKVLSGKFLSYGTGATGITNLEDQWKKWIEEHLSHEQTITNCLISAAYICYCGPFERDIRQRICENFATFCVKYEIPREPQQLFKDFTLPEFLYSPIQLREMQLLRLPNTDNILENGCFLLEDKSYDNWPLLCDRSRRSIDWLKTYHKDKPFLVLRQFEMKSALETCLSEGQYLLLTDCDVNDLVNNKRIETVLRNKNRFLTSEKPFKLNLGNHEIECNPKFRLFLHTVSEPIEVPPVLAAYTLVINYKLLRHDIEEELLDRFLILAKPRVDGEKFGLLQEKVNTLKIIDPLEQDITDFLASEVDLLNSVEPTKKLSDLKKLYDEAIDSNIRIETAEEPLIKTRESYREIALRGAICYDVIICLKELNCNYILSFGQFKNMFDESLYQFERSSTPQVIGKLTQTVFSSVSRLLNESDRKIYSILLSLEIEAAAGHLRAGEREFLISPVYGAYFTQTITGKQITESKYWSSKKPFDWMTDEQFLNLQYLAISQNWFSEAFDRMGRDGRETQWRTLCETDLPENGILPDKLDEVLTPIQRCCIIRAVRGDRILQIALSLVAIVLGKNYTARNSIDFEAIFSESTVSKPVVITYLEESETIRRMFINFAKLKVGNNYSIIDVNSLGLPEEKQIKKIFAKPMEEGNWILLHNCHNSTSMLNQIETVISESSGKINPNFRCWITLLQDKTKPPSSLILNSTRVFISSATTTKENIVRAFNWVESDQVKLSNKSEWPILLHNLCFFHASLNLRTRYIRCGWNSPGGLQFTTEEFLEAMRVAMQEFSSQNSSNNETTSHNLSTRSESLRSTSELVNLNKTVSLQAIKYIISDLIYGCSASNEYDLQAIESLGEFWISSVATRRDFEISKLKYKIPNSFLNFQPKLSVLQQSLENIMPYQLDAPEACHLLPSIEGVLGDDVLIMTRLGKLIDNLPSSSINVKISDRPLTPFDNSIVPQINSNSNNPLIYPMSEFSTASHMATQSKKYNDLNEYSSLILSSKIPKIFSKDQINEKVKKSGGWSTYNNWIVNEMNLLANLITVIKNHLQIIKNITENKKLGCDWDAEITEVADSLYHQQLPQCWCILSGSKTSFPYYPLGSFFTELISRFQHIEKCLTMGRDRMPAYNLSVFYNPNELLALFKHEFLKSKNQSDEIGCIENLVFQSEMTSRDKDHLRDPPKEGIFIYGLYLWGCHWEKSSSELQDQSIKTKDGFMSLPVIHLTCWLESEKPLLNDISKVQDLYKCPVYANRKEREQSLFEIDMMHNGVPAQKWAMRGVCATLKPY